MRRSCSGRLGMVGVALGAFALGAGCGDDLTYRYADVVQVTAKTPFPGACNGESQTGEDYPSLEAEPSIAIDPTDGLHLVAAWQQDRWSNGGSNGNLAATSFDGGRTWTTSQPHWSRCAGGDPTNHGDYDRSTDPWVSIGPDGTVYGLALSFDNATVRNAILAVQSIDGGRTWSEPAVLQFDDDADVFNDKDSLTADPTIPGRAYATWDRLTGQTMPSQPVGTGPAMLARGTDGVWEPAVPIYDPGVDAQTIGNIIVVAPDGTLVDVFDRLTMASAAEPIAEVDAIRSTDHGTTWSQPVTIHTVEVAGVMDGKHGVYVRSGELPAAAVDPVSGAIYVTWEQSFDGTDGAAFSASTDGGQTWSAMTEVNQAPDVPAFTSVVAVGSDGSVGVSYYDTRDDVASDVEHFDVAAFLVTSRDHGATWTEDRLTGAFDLVPALVGQDYFLGDYEGLAASGPTMVPFFAATYVAGDDPTDMFVRPVR